jgi:hypothetical protein
MDDVGLYKLWSLGKFYGHWVQFVVIWYVFPSFGMLYHGKSGNLGQDSSSGRDLKF